MRHGMECAICCMIFTRIWPPRNRISPHSLSKEVSYVLFSKSKYLNDPINIIAPVITSTPIATLPLSAGSAFNPSSQTDTTTSDANTTTPATSEPGTILNASISNLDTNSALGSSTPGLATNDVEMLSADNSVSEPVGATKSKPATRGKKVEDTRRCA